MQKENESKKLSLVEILLIGVALILISLGLTLYFTGYPVVRYWVGFAPDEQVHELAGYLLSSSGSVKRQVSGHTEYQDVSGQVVLYDKDVIVTGSNGYATIQFEQGGTVTLGPDSMVKIAFATEVAIGGVKRVKGIEVVSGKVSGQGSSEGFILRSGGKEIQVGPNASKNIEVLLSGESPRSTGAQLKVFDADGNMIQSDVSSEQASKGRSQQSLPVEAIVRVLKKPIFDDSRISTVDSLPIRIVEASFELDPPDVLVRVLVRKKDSLQVAVDSEMQAENGKSNLSFYSRFPGEFEYEIQSSRRKPLKESKNARGLFTVRKELPLVGVLDPLVAGQKRDSNRLKDRLIENFEAVLRWKPLDGMSEYNLLFFRSEKGSVFAKKVVQDPEYFLSRTKVFYGKLFYQVRASFESGYEAVSPISSYEFRFLPPLLTEPRIGQKISRAAVSEGILLTWEKTNFTQKYQIEISRDPDFKKSVLNKKTRKNYFLLKGPALGNYWWRVRSLGEKVQSQMSQASQFEIQK